MQPIPYKRPRSFWILIEFKELFEVVSYRKNMGLKYAWSSWRFLLLVFIAEFAFHGFTYGEKAPNYSFIQEATSAPQVSLYDYIIIGGGTAGCPLAATLSRNATVLVLGRWGSPYVNTTKIRIENALSTLTDTSPDSFSEAFISEDGVANIRARVLGGGTVINAGFYSRAETFFLMQKGLNEALANDSYEWVERKLVSKPVVLQWQSAKITFTTKAFNKFTIMAVGLRPKAQGVIFYDAQGVKHTAFLKNESMSEIISSAGAIGSPQLLLLSGIGPAPQLEALGIKVVLNHAIVGQGMADNPLNGLMIPSPVPVQLSLVISVGITKLGNYIEFGSGFDNPEVRFNYYQAPEDLRKCVPGMKTVIKVVNSKSYSRFRDNNTTTQDLLNMMASMPLTLRPKHPNSTASLEQYCIDTVMTIWHYH
ncbi:Glucose-methanol-choline (GMC) oxidoreductase family protein, putative [Theobroma cacao]|uniref:Glucose-methanol-choline (GMC) oxidoreductase family protein, putative n=1 Tax=Theobroma cacao TaxID=3641 RepID=A0A061EZG9_THECC|nr:Glucose-methanol-choline (GMC) oxidoreductase family protein, putative [Theobroma cacao]